MFKLFNNCKYSEKMDEKKKMELFNNADMCIEILEEMMNDHSHKVRIQVARHKLTTPEMLDRLSKDNNNFVRSFVAINKNIETKTMLYLSEDSCENVRFRLLSENKNLPIEIIKKLSFDENRIIKASALQKLSKI